LREDVKIEGEMICGESCCITRLQKSIYNKEATNEQTNKQHPIHKVMIMTFSLVDSSLGKETTSSGKRTLKRGITTQSSVGSDKTYGLMAEMASINKDLTSIKKEGGTPTFSDVKALANRVWSANLEYDAAINRMEREKKMVVFRLNSVINHQNAHLHNVLTI
jgi:hypothetical protein